jgi:hypothetical protein
MTKLREAIDRMKRRLQIKASREASAGIKEAGRKFRQAKQETTRRLKTELGRI